MTITDRIRAEIAPTLAKNPAATWESAVPEDELNGNFDDVWQAGQENGEAHLAKRISLLLDAIAPTTVSSEEELEELPVGSTVLAHWEDGSQPDYHMMRCREGGASSSGFGVAGGKHWTGMANWGATLTVLGRGKA